MRGNLDTIMRRLKSILRDALPDADIDAIQLRTMPHEVMGWDSMAHVTVIVGVEEEFGVVFSPQEVTAFSNVGDLVALIASKSGHG